MYIYIYKICMLVAVKTWLSETGLKSWPDSSVS